MKSTKNIGETRRKWIKNNYIKTIKFGLQKEKEKWKEKQLTKNLKFNKGSCSLELSPENVHQKNYKTLKIEWYTWENPKPPKDACSNLKP
jgi:hypothetical protein